MAVFREPHERVDEAGNPLPHLNSLLRANKQHSWKQVAKVLWDKYKIRVDFAKNIHTWYDGIIYGTVSSTHKEQDKLDPTPLLGFVRDVSGGTLTFPDTHQLFHFSRRQGLALRFQTKS